MSILYFLVMTSQSAGAAIPKLPIVMPPKAAQTTGEITEISLAPIALDPYYCIEHPVGQLAYAGDALGSDCMILGGDKFPRLYRTNGETNEDWYGWHAILIAPVAGVVVGAYDKKESNRPGTFGSPPASMLQIRTMDGIIVNLSHIVDLKVKVGDRVVVGQPIGRVGNNGTAAQPHTHVGAYRERDNMPLQIRWDLHAMAKLLQQAG